MKKALSTERRNRAIRTIRNGSSSVSRAMVSFADHCRQAATESGVARKAYATIDGPRGGAGRWVPFISAIVLGSAGMLTMQQDLLGGPLSDKSVTSEVRESMLGEALDSILKPHVSPLEEVLLHPRHMQPLAPDLIDNETLWLARAVFSETKRPEEQVLVAWVIRNRVETAYRGRTTYESVVLDPNQFSAFKADNPLHSFYTGLTGQTNLAGWDTALSISYLVRNLDTRYRPFPLMTRHFYSERSMIEPHPPVWARNQTPVAIDAGVLQLDQRRFRFFSDVS